MKENCRSNDQIQTDTVSRRGAINGRRKSLQSQEWLEWHSEG